MPALPAEAGSRWRIGERVCPYHCMHFCLQIADFPRPNMFWKMSKVSFREIITMKTVDPVFKDRDLASLLRPQPNGSSRSETRGKSSARPGSSSTVPDSPDSITERSSVRHQIQNQGESISRISNTVNTLHDTMNEIKHAFTALRLELSNGPSLHPSEPERANGGFDMLATVLKELKNKSDEIERLRLENEALKLKNRYLEERVTGLSSGAPHLLEAGAPTETHSPGLLNENGKRPWSEAAHTTSAPRQMVVDSFDDEEEDNDLPDDISLGDVTTQSIKVPLKEPGEIPATSDTMVPEQTPPPNPRPRVEVYHNRGRGANPAMTDGIRDNHLNNTEQQQPANKRPRLSDTEDNSQNKSAAEPPSEKRKRGRPRGWRKSVSHTTKPDPPQTPKPAPLGEQDVNVGSGTTTTQGEGPAAANPSPDDPPSSKSVRSRGRSRRRRSSVPPPSTTSTPRVTRKAERDREKQGDADTNPQEENNNPEQENTATTAQASPQQEETTNEESVEQQSVDTDQQQQQNNSSNNTAKENAKQDPMRQGPNPTATDGNQGQEEERAREKRKAQVAARDALAKLAMQREEAMAME